MIIFGDYDDKGWYIQIYKIIQELKIMPIKKNILMRKSRQMANMKIKNAYVWFAPIHLSNTLQWWSFLYMQTWQSWQWMNFDVLYSSQYTQNYFPSTLNYFYVIYWKSFTPGFINNIKKYDRSMVNNRVKLMTSAIHSKVCGDIFSSMRW